MLLEAIRVADGRPVYAVLWDHSDIAPQPALDEATFRSMLQFASAFPGIDGVFMWEGSEDRVPFYEAVLTELITGDAEGDFPDP